MNLAIVRISQKAFADARSMLFDARPHLQSALRADPQAPTARRFWRNWCWTLCDAHLGLGDHAELARAARELAALDFETDDLYRAACYLSRGVSLADLDATLAPDRRLELSEKYGAEAVGLLSQQIRRGRGDRQQMKSDDALAPLRLRPDFKGLLAELEGNPTVP